MTWHLRFNLIQIDEIYNKGSNKVSIYIDDSLLNIFPANVSLKKMITLESVKDCFFKKNI